MTTAPQTPSNAKPELVEQLKLSLDIALGLQDLFTLGAHHLWLLQLPLDLTVQTPDDERQVREATRDILMEILTAALPPPRIDKQAIALEFLRRIRDNDGRLRPHEILLDPDLLREMAADELIQVGANGVIWGRMAAAALRKFGGESKEEASDGT